jgi:hypothetical protein
MGKANGYPLYEGLKMRLSSQLISLPVADVECRWSKAISNDKGGIMAGGKKQCLMRCRLKVFLTGLWSIANI